MSTLRPTAEQAAILDAVESGGPLVIEAAAGSGKTSTLRMIAAATSRRGAYLAYTRATKDDAVASFPRSVRCVTSHGLAFGPVATKYKHRLGGSRIPAQQAAKLLGVNEPVRLTKDLAPLAPAQLVRIATATVERFCYSADDEITARYVPPILGAEDCAVRAILVEAVLPIARKAWADICSVGGQLRFEHDHYLKMYQLTRPSVRVDYLLVDEAQDLNPVVQAIVSYQRHAQVILVGDRYQQLYAWRGAVDAMAKFEGERLRLSQSFRFGPAIAAEANKWLSVLHADMRVRGLDRLPSTVGPLDTPDAILCRTNATAIVRVIDALDQGRKVALVGGGGQISRLAKAAVDLQAGRPCDHPELLAFTHWSEVQDYVDQDTGGGDLKVLVGLVDKHGADALIAIADRLVKEDQAEVIVSTAHKSKGREWESVTITDDFYEPKMNEYGERGQIEREAAMLAYVSVTRAKLRLDRTGLAWVDAYVPGSPRSIVEIVQAEPARTPDERADREAIPSPQPALAHCGRCGSATCSCDPAAARAWSARTGIPAGAPAAYARNRAQGRDVVESAARALIGIPDGP